MAASGKEISEETVKVDRLERQRNPCYVVAYRAKHAANPAIIYGSRLH